MKFLTFYANDIARRARHGRNELHDTLGGFSLTSSGFTTEGRPHRLGTSNFFFFFDFDFEGGYKPNDDTLTFEVVFHFTIHAIGQAIDVRRKLVGELALVVQQCSVTVKVLNHLERIDRHKHMSDVCLRYFP